MSDIPYSEIPPSTASQTQTLDQILGAPPKPPTLDEILNKRPTGDDLGNSWIKPPFADSVGSALRYGLPKGWGGSAELSPETERNLKDWGIFNDYEKGQNSIIRRFNEGLLRPAIAGADILFSRLPGAVHEAAVEAPVLGPIAAGMEAFPAGHMTGFPTRVPVRPPPAAVPITAEDLAASARARLELTPSGVEEPTERVVSPTANPNWEGTAEPAATSDADIAATGAAAVAERSAPAPDLHAIARQIAPDTFSVYDELAAHKQTLTGFINDLAEQRDKGTSSEITALDSQIEQLRAQRLEAARGDRAGLANQITALETQRASLADALPKEGDTPEMARLRQARQELDYQMRDLAPEVSAAYRRAEAGELPEAAAEPAGAPEAPAAPEVAPTPEPAPVAPPVPALPRLRVANISSTGKIHIGEPGELHSDLIAKEQFGEPGFADETGKFYTREEALALLNERERKILSETRATELGADMGVGQNAGRLEGIALREAQAAAPTPPAEPIPGGITGDVSRQLVAAGRPVEEANAAGALVQAHYEARAERFGGALGSAEDLYRAEAPTIRAGRGVRAQIEEASGTATAEPAREFAQTRRGKIRLADPEKDARAEITLFKDADASTFIHETGHAWLEELAKDAIDERAPPDLKTDMATVRNWLGVAEGEAIPTRAHEKFARGFERYMMEGHAPSTGLARVFEQFKDWLTKIYETVTRLRAPINDDIRGVFDRMLSTGKERPVIAPEREPTGTFADLHEADAATTPPPQAGEIAPLVRTERDSVGEAAHPEIEDERVSGRAPSEDGGGAAGGNVSGPSSPTGEPNAAPAGRVSEPRSVGEGGGNAAAEGNRLSEQRRSADAGPDTSGPAASRVGEVRTAWIHRLNTTQDAKSIILEMSARTQDFRDARFGQAAYQLYHDARAARLLVEDISQATVEAGTKWADSGSEADAVAYARTSQQLLMAAELYSEIKAGWGRAGHAFQRIDRIAAGQSVADYVKKITGRTLDQLTQERDLSQALPSADARADFIGETRATRWQKIRAAYLSYFINNLISGPITHGGYAVGNTNLALFKAVADTSASAAIDSFREMIAGKPLDNRVQWAEVPAQLYGAVRGWRDGWGAAGEALKTGVPYMKGAELITKAAEGVELPNAAQAISRPQAIPGRVGYVLETPSRAVTAIHTLFYSMGYEQEIARLAVRSAISNKLTGEAYNAHVAEFTQNPPMEAIEHAHNEALAMVLMKRPAFNSAMSNIQRAVNNNVVAKTVMPFMQIGANILDQAFVQHTPLAFASTAARNNLLATPMLDYLRGRNGTVAQSLQYGKIASGVMLSTAVIGLTAEQILTGSGPSDPRERMRLELTGWKPYSIRIGDHYYPYRKLIGPLGALVGGVANMYEVAHTAGTGEYAQAASAAIFGFSQVVADETWLRGLSDFINAARNWDKDGGRYLRNLGADFVPFAIGMGQMAQLIDPYQREVHSFTDAVKNKIPVLRQTLETRNDIYGEPITQHTMVGPSAVVNDPVTNALIRLDIPVAPITRKIDGVGLNDQQYYELTQTAGRLMKMRLDNIVGGANFTNLPEASQRDVITKTIEASRKQARALILHQNLDIGEAARAAQRAYREGASHKQKLEMLKAH
jgi:hypothetical protein